MALIFCPECKQQVSDFALSCPHCGYPIRSNLSDNQNNESYSLILYGTTSSKIELMKIVNKILNCGLQKAREIVNNRPSFLVKNAPFTRCEEIKNMIGTLGETSIEYYNSQNDNQLLNKYKPNGIICPRCGSSAVTTGQRGFSIVTGFWGSNKTVNRCGKCGYSWQPK